MESNVFQHSNHIALWTWLAENPEKDKEDWVGWSFNGGKVGRVLQLCFACEYKADCNKCPLMWNSSLCYGYNAILHQWKTAINPQERTLLALEIAGLPVKPGIICV